MDLRETAASLRLLVAEYEGPFLQIPDSAAGRAPAPDKWSRKQILGHLIDSAANNHQRFIRLQLAQELRFPGYEQDRWVDRNSYADEPWPELVTLWAAYNRHLAHVIEHIDPSTLNSVWESGETRSALGFIVGDYPVHLRHHAAQILKG